MEKIIEVITQGYVSITNSLSQEEGQGMVEYGLIIALVAVFLIAGLNLLAPAIAATFTAVTTELGAAVP